MPIYEYKCENCGKVMEVLSPSHLDDRAPERCSCGEGSKLVRIFSTFAAHAEKPPEPHFAPCGYEGCCGGTCGLEDG